MTVDLLTGAAGIAAGPRAGPQLMVSALFATRR
jgi:hypothetical protein